MTKKDCSCSCFSCFLGRNTPSTSSPATAFSKDVDTNAAFPTVATRHDPRIPASTSKSNAQLRSVEPCSSSSAHQDASSCAVVVNQDKVLPPPPSGDAFSSPSHLPYVASSSSTVPETAISSFSFCVPTVVMATEDIYHSQQSVASSTQPGEAQSSSLHGMSSSSSIGIRNKDGSALEGDNVEVDLDGLIKHISQRLELIQGSKNSSKRKGAQQYWPPASKTLFKLKEFVSEGINVVQDVIPGDAIKTAVSAVLQGMGTAHLVTAGLVVVANIVERFEEVDANKAECLRLLKEMIFLAKLVKHFKESPQGMYDVIKEATELVVEGYIMCCCQIDSSKFSKFFKALVNKEDLDNFRQEIDRMYRQIYTQMGICILDANDRKKAPLSRRYPEHAVGVREPAKEIIDLLELGSEKNAIAVMLHGFGGIGKTTLADAVFSLLDIQGCKYSTVQLFENIDSTPKIVELQRLILKDLMEHGETVPDIRKHEDGQRELGGMLEKVPAFIYIDNVLGQDELGRLLPKDMNKAKKVRLLLTARNIEVRRALQMKTIVYAMKGLPDAEAMHLLGREIYDGTNYKEKQINSTQLNKIVQSYGGIPKLLELVGGFIREENDKQKAYRILLKEKDKWDSEIGKIESYLFAYNYLPEVLKDPFLDICSFFKGWAWDTVADIVGQIELDMLESRALVTRGINGVVVVHDVILSIGLQKTKGIRFTFTNGKQIKELLNEKEIPDIKGIWLSENNKDLLDISASKLDFMYSSLRVLALGNFIKVQDKCNKTFGNLIFLQAAIPNLPFDVSKSKGLKYLKYEPKDLNFRKIPSSLRYMEFDGRLHPHAFEISSGDLQQLGNLRILNLTHFVALKNLPEDLGDLVNGLEELTLSYCTSVEELPQSILKLQSLRSIRMEYCSSLRQLPEDFGWLTSLQELNFQGCKNLILLPNNFEKLTALKLLNLSFCERLLDLPHGLGNLTSLAELGLKKCSELRSIPESIGQMNSLALSMDMSGCSSLKELPNGICNLSFITDLSLVKCSNLQRLPDRIGELVNLRKFYLEECTSLKKLPEGFGRLKCLKKLDLADCYNLEELCYDFHRLCCLESLHLDGCHSLKRLPEYFHCLPSLRRFYLSGCPMLKGKEMDLVLKIKTLQYVTIVDSQMLLKRWEEIQKEGNPLWSLVVRTGQALSKDERDNIEKNLSSELDSLLTNGQGEPFHLSDHLRADSLLLLIFDFHRDYCYDFPWPLFEDTIYEIQTNFEIIYMGSNFNKLPVNVKGKIVGHRNRDTHVYDVHRKVISTFDTADQSREEDGKYSYIQMRTKMVRDKEGATKYLPCWKLLTGREVEEFLLCNCRSYHRLTQLVQTARESNIELLKELFATGREPTTDIFQRNKNYGSEKLQASNQNSRPFACGVEELEGKRIFLDIRPLDICCDIRLGSLIQLYNMMKESLNLEVISIPLVQPNTNIRLEVFEQFSGEVPWLVLKEPWILTRVVKYFLIKGCLPDQGSELWAKERPIITIIEPNGKLFTADKPVLPLLDRWGPKAYPFTLEKIKELEEEELSQMKTMSHVSFPKSRKHQAW